MSAVRKTAEQVKEELEAAANRQRKVRSEADTAEMKAMDQAGKIVVIDDARSALADWAVRVSKEIQRPEIPKQMQSIILDITRLSLIRVADALEGKGDE